MRKIILILSLFLMVSLIAFGKMTRQETKEFYNFLYEQHEEHPGWVYIMFYDIKDYVRDLEKPIAKWNSKNNYKLEFITNDSEYGDIGILLLNEELLNENGFIYDKELREIYELPVKSWYDDRGALHEVYRDGSKMITYIDGKVENIN